MQVLPSSTSLRHDCRYRNLGMARPMRACSRRPLLSNLLRHKPLCTSFVLAVPAGNSKVADNQKTTWFLPSATHNIETSTLVPPLGGLECGFSSPFLLSRICHMRRLVTQGLLLIIEHRRNRQAQYRERVEEQDHLHDSSHLFSSSLQAHSKLKCLLAPLQFRLQHFAKKKFF